MTTDVAQTQTAPRLPQKQQVIFVGVVAVAGVLYFVFSLESPIRGGKENVEKARTFLKEQFPDREVSPHDDRHAPVAVVYELIRSGEPAVARRAIDFAAEQRFGYAAPYVIGRLDSGDAELERAAQDFLRTIAGRDYGPDAESWRAWWRNPPWPFLPVVSLGQTTVTIAIPATLAFVGVLLTAAGRVGHRWTAVDMGPPFVAIAWIWGCFLVQLRLGLDIYTGTFGPTEVEYYYGHGTAIGLEDAKIRYGTGLWILWVAVLGVGTVVILFGLGFLGRRPEPGVDKP